VLKLKALAQEKGLGSADADQAAIFVDPAMNAIVAQSFFNNEPYPYRYLGHPLDNPVMRCIRQVAFRDVSSKELRNQYVEKFLKKDHRENAEENLSGGKKKRNWGRDVASDSNIPSKKAKYTKQFTTLSSYLCTGYDAFLAREPNAFTAMAMLHSRVGRVFYMDDDPKRGVLGNDKSVQLHTLKGINHRYRVYKCKFDKVDKLKS
jgi:tRNA-specific adenosine deaminase 3